MACPVVEEAEVGQRLGANEFAPFHLVEQHGQLVDVLGNLGVRPPTLERPLAAGTKPHTR